MANSNVALQARGSVATRGVVARSNTTTCNITARGNVAPRSVAACVAVTHGDAASRLVSDIALQQWRAALPKFLFFLVGKFNGLLYT
ncbi:unnamed protein product [Sphagnum balticum]